MYIDDLNKIQLESSTSFFPKTEIHMEIKTKNTRS